MTTTTSRRAILAGIAAAPAIVGVPAIALSSTAPDPVFAAIEQYKTALRVRRAAMDMTRGSGAPHLEGLPKHAPECVAADELHDAAVDHEFASLDRLLATPPTTMFGAIAFLEYLAVQPYNTDGRSANDPTVAEMASERGERDDGSNSLTNSLTNVAQALRALIKAGAVS